MGKKSKDELLKELIAAFQPKIREMVLAIMEEKLRLNPHALDGAGTAEADRQDFKTRSVTK